MDELSDKLKKIEFRMLCDVDDFCNKNGITYYLSGGTCLGAVRHKGFIPWDDDIDIMLPRDEYNKFIKSFGDSYKEKYQVGSLETDPLWTRNGARIWNLRTKLRQKKFSEQIMGVFIDVFPIDGIPEKRNKQFMHLCRIKILHAIRNSVKRKKIIKSDKWKSIKILLKIISLPFDDRKLTEKIDKLLQKYEFDECNYVGALAAVHYWGKEIIEKSSMRQPTYMEFEGRMFPVPIGYHKYLTNLYGDYETPIRKQLEKGYSHLDGWEVEIPDELMLMNP